MNLKHILYPIACLIFVIAFAACNSDNEYSVDSEKSPEGRITSFTISARPFTKMDSLTYPAMSKTKFTINNRTGFEIFNNDSLPVKTDIRTLKVDLKYASNIHAKTDLVYPKDSTDYPSEWNETDSVKFFQVKGSDIWYPQFKVMAPNNSERLYYVTFNIHKQDLDSINWEHMKDFSLKRAGDTKVILSTDKASFIAYTLNGGKVYKYTSPVVNPQWTEYTTNLPNTVDVKSLHATDKFFVMITTDQKAYTSPIADGENWTPQGNYNIKSIVGVLPEIVNNRANPLNEFLITVDNGGGELLFAKTSDFKEADTNIALQSWPSNKVMDGFPIKGHSAMPKVISSSETYLMTIAGKDTRKNRDEQLVTKPWVIKNISLGNKAENKPAQLDIMGGKSYDQIPYKAGITAFWYDDKIQAISSDSLSLYTSLSGDLWEKASAKQKLKEGTTDQNGMEKMNMPSVVIDRDNYMWVFGGISNAEEINPTYSQKVWKGRIHRLGFKRK